MRYIEKKSVVELPPASGSISDTTNITDKVTNAYSARLVEEKLNSKQNTLTAGDNISIVNNVISSTGGANLDPVAIVGSDAASSSGWYKVADSTMSSYGNTNITYLIKEGYKQKHVGILQLEMRSNNTSIACWMCEWLVRGAIPYDNVRIVIDGMKWTMYYKVNSGQYGRVSFIELQHRSINGSKPTYTVNYYNTTTKETTEPDATAVSADGGYVKHADTASTASSATKATQDSDGNQINTTYLKNSGGTLTGPLKWGGNDALPANSGLKYILGIDAFADGGQTRYINIGDMSVGKAAKLTTARKINGVSFDGSADITLPNATTSANGMMSSTDKTKLDGIGELITKTYSFQLEAGVWTDTGITGNNLTTGTYIIQVKADFSGTAGIWDERFSGVMTWYSGNTNSGVSDEIVLHNSGHAPNAGKLYLRTIRQGSNSGGIKLQIASKVAMAAAKDIVFYFRKMI